MFIYGASDQTLGINPNNSAGSFTIQMPEAFTAPKNSILKGQWYLGLIDIVIPPVTNKWAKWDVMYVTCTQLEGSVVGDASERNKMAQLCTPPTSTLCTSESGGREAPDY